MARRYTVDCACGCGPFEAGSPRARWAKPGCKKRAQRAAAPDTSTTAPAGGTATSDPTAGTKPIDALEQAVRDELTKAGQLASVDGQIAVHLARQVKAATGSAAASLAKELRTVLDRAVATGQPPAPDPGEAPAPVEDDEVTRARKQREAMAAAAAAAAE